MKLGSGLGVRFRVTFFTIEILKLVYKMRASYFANTLDLRD